MPVAPKSAINAATSALSALVQLDAPISNSPAAFAGFCNFILTLLEVDFALVVPPDLPPLASFSI
jgi:hypothetical protein